jgi:hypothetical protein
MAKRKVVVTGAAGRMAGLILDDLRERYDLLPLDVRSSNDAGEAIDGIQQVDLLNKDRSAYREFFRAADTVCHFGFVRSTDRDDVDGTFSNEFSNVQMAYNVYQAAWEENVRRVVMVSSNHAADYYERLILDGKWDFVDPNGRALSDNYYGWAKEVYEHLGFVFAVGKQARPSSAFTSGERTMSDRQLEVVEIRIGGPRETDVEACKLGDLRCMRRALGVYISDRDLQQLFIKSIETSEIRDAQGIPFQIFYGISGNSHAFWSIANARTVIGYAPEDNSEIPFRQLIQRHIDAALGDG